MRKQKLLAEKRKIAGKKVKTLRQQGVLPGNIYGKKVKSLSVQISQKDFEGVFKEAGETGVVELAVAGESQARPVLIHNVQLNPVTSSPLHADFFQVDLKEKVKAMVPLEIIGEAPATKEKKGILLNTLNELEVEALPTDLPEKIEVDISSLSKVDQEIKVGELKVSSGAAVLNDPELVVCKIGPLVTAAAEEEMKKEEEEAAAAAAGEETEEKEETPVEGVPTEEKEKEKSSEEKPAQESEKKRG